MMDVNKTNHRLFIDFLELDKDKLDNTKMFLFLKN